jgi:hypothetical protein
MVKPLPTNAPLLLKILNGDYEYSHIFEDAKFHRDEAKLAYEKAYTNYLGNTNSGRVEAAMDSGRMKRVKAVKSEIEAGLDEIRILDKLKRDLEIEFGIDYWDEIMFGTVFEGTVLDLYFLYKEKSKMIQTPSEFDIKHKRMNSLKYLYLLERLNKDVQT